jgi:hypothetical protein
MRLVNTALGLAAVGIAVSAFGCLGAPDEGAPAASVDEPEGAAAQAASGRESHLQSGINRFECLCEDDAIVTACVASTCKPGPSLTADVPGVCQGLCGRNGHGNANFKAFSYCHEGSGTCPPPLH